MISYRDLYEKRRRKLSTCRDKKKKITCCSCARILDVHELVFCFGEIAANPEGIDVRELAFYFGEIAADSMGSDVHELMVNFGEIVADLLFVTVQWAGVQICVSGVQLKFPHLKPIECFLPLNVNGNCDHKYNSEYSRTTMTVMSN